MDHQTLLQNIERALKAQKVSADYVSKKARRPDAIRNLRRRVRGETNTSMTLDVLSDVATVLGTSPWELLRPLGAIPQDEEFRDYVRGVVEEQLTDRAPTARPQKRKVR
jgi:hypothetical protein